MDSVTIGGRQVAITRPADLDQQLVAATGCSAEEHAAMLRRVASPAAVTRVLGFMVAPGDLDAVDLASRPEEEVAAIAGAIAPLLVAPAATPPVQPVASVAVADLPSAGG